MNYKINVKYRYISSNTFNMTVGVYDLLNSIEQAMENRLETWLKSDADYDPRTVFVVSELNFDECGRATFIEIKQDGLE